MLYTFVMYLSNIPMGYTMYNRMHILVYFSRWLIPARLARRQVLRAAYTRRGCRN